MLKLYGIAFYINSRNLARFILVKFTMAMAYETISMYSHLSALNFLKKLKLRKSPRAGTQAWSGITSVSPSLQPPLLWWGIGYAPMRGVLGVSDVGPGSGL